MFWASGSGGISAAHRSRTREHSKRVSAGLVTGTTWMEESTLAIIALGSNAGDSRHTLPRAIQRLEELSEQPLVRSSVWRTSPVDCPPGSPEFLNAVVGLVPSAAETPESLLQKLQAIEREFGRQPKKILNEPRPLDLDLIAFGDEVRKGAELMLPHPRAHCRRFVLQPLCEIAPNLVLPGQSQTVAELLRGLRVDPGVRVCPDSMDGR
jgi:2-amino-4-hydroxy-6-hydroxymethyldihydropteridine diphosphokinase